MQKSKGSGFLKVCGILMIIGGALTIIFSGVMGIIAYVAGSALVSSGEVGTGEIVGTALLIGAILALISGILELIAGIVGVKNHNKPEKSTACLVWGIIVLVLNVISLILSFAGGSSNVATIIVSVLCGLALPVLYIIGAALNKKSA